MADHYSSPERYKDIPLWVYCLVVSKKALKSSRKSHFLTERYIKISYIRNKSLKLWCDLARKCMWYYI